VGPRVDVLRSLSIDTGIVIGERGALIRWKLKRF
jgi:hypothetical protein